MDLTSLSVNTVSGVDMATELQTKLQAMDEGRSNISVAWDDAAKSLTITDSAQRNISGATLTKVTSAASDVSTGNAIKYADSILKITALDPNVSASDIKGTTSAKGVVVTQGTAVVAADKIALQETPYTRATAAFTFDDTAVGFKATFGTATPPLFEEATSGSDLADKLNKNATFVADYIATYSAADKSLTITAKDPSSASAQTIANSVKVLQSVTEATGPFVQIEDIDATTGVSNNPVLTTGVASALDSSKRSIDDLKNLFTVNVDNSIDSVTVGLDHLIESMSKLPASASKKLSGTQIAAELTNVIARAYGDEKPFNFSTVGAPTFSLSLTRADKSTLPKLPIDLSTLKDLRNEDLVREVQKQIDDDPQYSGNLVVSYDTAKQQLVFTPTNNAKVTVSSDQTAMNLADPLVQGVNDSSVGLPLSPSVSTSPFRALNDQRYGMKVEYDAVKQSFVFQSGTTGDASGLSITGSRPGSLATQISKGLGMTGDPANYIITPSTVDALRGVASKPAVLTGNPLAVNVDNNFSVDSTNNQFVVSVNGITGTVIIPPKDTYTLGTFMEALQNGINNLQGPSKNGLTPESVNGVKVSYNSKSNALEFTTGTASTSSYVKITGDARWGLDGLDAKFGSTTTWIKPTPFKDDKGATVYIDGFGAESSTATGFDTLPAWSPVYFDKGELTFDTAGNLISPKQGAQLDTVYLPNGKGALTMNIDYAKSTQFASPFSVLSQSQDGAPEGDLVGLAIADDGLVSASFSNGSQKSLGKVVLVNFSNPSGLRQIGDTNYYKTSDSGVPKYGEAGSAGFGTVRSGATERANVDLTQELVDLITEQRNFQANAKAMETSTSMTQTIIQIRN
jgi:flagellar hook protein FlgE